jgi:hypothetical protein
MLPFLCVVHGETQGPAVRGANMPMYTEELQTCPHAGCFSVARARILLIPQIGVYRKSENFDSALSLRTTASAARTAPIWARGSKRKAAGKEKQ